MTNKLNTGSEKNNSALARAQEKFRIAVEERNNILSDAYLFMNKMKAVAEAPSLKEQMEMLNRLTTQNNKHNPEENSGEAHNPEENPEEEHNPEENPKEKHNPEEEM
ncbi:MAG: hypothetical protein NZL83_01010 [Candidatus Absconditabacterales bacterium]|nr:hypothetical protein [Candidatus Absconditabacterales bacterium]